MHRNDEIGTDYEINLDEFVLPVGLLNGMNVELGLGSVAVQPRTMSGLKECE